MNTMNSQRDLLSAKPRVVNLGLEIFVESLEAYSSPVVQVDWRPPAGGDLRMLELLQRLNQGGAPSPGNNPPLNV